MAVVYSFCTPAVTHFGWGAVERLSAEVPALGRKALLVTDPFTVEQFGGRVLDLLHSAGVKASVFRDVKPDPDPETVDRGAALAKAEGCEFVIGLGGGSPMDAARALAAAVGLGSPILDYLRGKVIDRPGLPLVTIATTAGTGSEVTHGAVISDPERGVKIGIRSPWWFARVAITDPEFTLSMPPKLTAATGLDALSHAIESCLSNLASPPTEALALRSIELIGQHLRAAYVDGANRAAREGMSYASMIAGMAFANSGLGLVHGIAHVIGARFHCSHGESCGRVLPGVMRFNQPLARERMTAIGRGLTGNPGASGDDAIGAVESLLRDLGVPSGLADLGASPNDIPSMSAASLLSGHVLRNPRPVGEEDCQALIKEMCGF